MTELSVDAPARSGWIRDWNPEDPRFWESQGRTVAGRNLAISMVAEHLAFGVWVVWTVVVLNLGNAGIKLPLSDLFVLTLLPNLIGSFLRLPYTWAVGRLGGRAWTLLSALFLLAPTLLLAASW